VEGDEKLTLKQREAGESCHYRKVDTQVEGRIGGKWAGGRVQHRIDGKK
jgi:hypothetical protein